MPCTCSMWLVSLLLILVLFLWLALCAYLSDGLLLPSHAWTFFFFERAAKNRKCQYFCVRFSSPLYSYPSMFGTRLGACCTPGSGPAMKQQWEAMTAPETPLQSRRGSTSGDGGSMSRGTGFSSSPNARLSLYSLYFFIFFSSCPPLPLYSLFCFPFFSSLLFSFFSLS